MALPGKLWKLKQWLTVPEAARHLSIMFGEEVREADVLRLALDGHLKLSVNFVNYVYGRCGKLISYEDKECLPPQFQETVESLSEEMKDPFLNSLKKIGHFEDQFLYLDDKVTQIEGVWDLSMVCGQRYCIENKYQMLTGGPEVTSPIIGAVFVVREGGQVCRIQERFDESEELNFRNESDRYYPAVAESFPNDNSVLVVRTSALTDLQVRLEKENEEEANGKATVKDDIGAKRGTWLKIIYLLAARLANTNPVAYKKKNGSFNFLQFEGVLKDIAGDLWVNEDGSTANKSYGLSNDNLKIIFDEAKKLF